MQIEEKINNHLWDIKNEKEIDEAFKECYDNLKLLNIKEQQDIMDVDYRPPINEELVSATLIISTLSAMPAIMQ